MYFILPIFLLSIFNGTLGEIIRHIRGELEEILKKEYMQAVRARGLGRLKYWWHALRNVLAPSIGLVTSNLTLLLGGAVVLEYVFILRGIGYQAWESAGKRDTPVILGITVILVFCVVVIRFLSDLFCYIIDPRFQSETEK
jgi:peptide/nickel transport system permease protein